MKLGAQLFSVRQFTQNYEDLRSTFGKLKDIGYDSVQVSAIGPIPAEKIAEASNDYSLPVTCTHTPLKRILEETDKVIEEHKIFGCSQIGIGWIDPKEYDTVEKATALIEKLSVPAKKIKAAGLSLAYHNHAAEFDDIGGTCFLDLMIDTFPEMHFILDTYWAVYADKDPIDYINKIGGARMENMHFKDMATAGKGKICACGNGILDFAKIYDAAEKAGVKNVMVEEDNAQDEYGDAFKEMAISYEHLKHLFNK